ncbi:hypothetical protein [Terrabacter sp. MAHUQ-38]|jgi:hypothetical protein|uniref:hypothetical protein n=1 Tax=unclassified Terrabacter TaxID=2630222 RepID=UPI00165D6654|nr:hypothetical protein [Terrabacter sp. MAHUQ-38]MBC9823626.1 hypothetical protein [Terrabacter sp. MAHUQ-38]
MDLDGDVRAVGAHHVRLVDAVSVGLDALDRRGRLLGPGGCRHLGGGVAREQLLVGAHRLETVLDL